MVAAGGWNAWFGGFFVVTRSNDGETNEVGDRSQPTNGSAGQFKAANGVSGLPPELHGHQIIGIVHEPTQEVNPRLQQPEQVERLLLRAP